MNAELLQQAIARFHAKGGSTRYVPLGAKTMTRREIREAVRGDNLSAPTVCSRNRWDDRAPSAYNTADGIGLDGQRTSYAAD